MSRKSESNGRRLISGRSALTLAVFLLAYFFLAGDSLAEDKSVSDFSPESVIAQSSSVGAGTVGKIITNVFLDWLMDNPQVFPIQGTGLGRVTKAVLVILIPAYEVVILLTGLYVIFAALIPPRRAHAKAMFTRLMTGLVLVSLAPVIYQLILDIELSLLTQVFAVGGGVPSDASVIALLAILYLAFLPPFTGTLGVAVVVIVILLPVIIIGRNLVVAMFGALFPAALFLYSFDYTRSIGAKMIRWSLIWIFVPIVQAIFWIVMFDTLTTMRLDVVNIITGVVISVSAFVLMVAAPLLMTTLMKEVGAVVWKAGERRRNIALMTVGGILRGHGPGAFQSAAYHSIEASARTGTDDGRSLRGHELRVPPGDGGLVSRGDGVWNTVKSGYRARRAAGGGMLTSSALALVHPFTPEGFKQMAFGRAAKPGEATTSGQRFRARVERAGWPGKVGWTLGYLAFQPVRVGLTVVGTTIGAFGGYDQLALPKPMIGLASRTGAWLTALGRGEATWFVRDGQRKSLVGSLRESFHAKWREKPIRTGLSIAAAVGAGALLFTPVGAMAMVPALAVAGAAGAGATLGAGLWQRGVGASIALEKAAGARGYADTMSRGDKRRARQIMREQRRIDRETRGIDAALKHEKDAGRRKALEASREELAAQGKRLGRELAAVGSHGLTDGSGKVKDSVRSRLEEYSTAEDARKHADELGKESKAAGEDANELAGRSGAGPDKTGGFASTLDSAIGTGVEKAQKQFQGYISDMEKTADELRKKKMRSPTSTLSRTDQDKLDLANAQIGYFYSRTQEARLKGAADALRSFGNELQTKERIKRQDRMGGANAEDVRNAVGTHRRAECDLARGEENPTLKTMSDDPTAGQDAAQKFRDENERMHKTDLGEDYAGHKDKTFTGVAGAAAIEGRPAELREAQKADAHVKNAGAALKAKNFSAAESELNAAVAAGTISAAQRDSMLGSLTDDQKEDAPVKKAMKAFKEGDTTRAQDELSRAVLAGEISTKQKDGITARFNENYDALKKGTRKTADADAEYRKNGATPRYESLMKDADKHFGDAGVDAGGRAEAQAAHDFDENLKAEHQKSKVPGALSSTPDEIKADMNKGATRLNQIEKAIADDTTEERKVGAAMKKVAAGKGWGDLTDADKDELKKGFGHATEAETKQFLFEDKVLDSTQLISAEDMAESGMTVGFADKQANTNTAELYRRKTENTTALAEHNKYEHLYAVHTGQARPGIEGTKEFAHTQQAAEAVGAAKLSETDNGRKTLAKIFGFTDPSGEGDVSALAAADANYRDMRAGDAEATDIFQKKFLSKLSETVPTDTTGKTLTDGAKDRRLELARHAGTSFDDISRAADANNLRNMSALSGHEAMDYTGTRYTIQKAREERDKGETGGDGMRMLSKGLGAANVDKFLDDHTQAEEASKTGDRRALRRQRRLEDEAFNKLNATGVTFRVQTGSLADDNRSLASLPTKSGINLVDEHGVQGFNASGDSADPTAYQQELTRRASGAAKTLSTPTAARDELYSIEEKSTVEREEHAKQRRRVNQMAEDTRKRIRV